MIQLLALTLIHSLWEQAAIAVAAAVVADRLHHRPAIERLRVYELAAVASVVAPLLTAWALASNDAAPGPTPGWTAAVAVAWAIGVTTSVARLGFEGLRVEWVRATSIAAPPALTRGFERLASELGLRGVELRIVSDGWSPMAIGVVRRAVLVPAGLLARLPADQLESLLLHELVHLRRWDPLAVAAQLVFEAALFHHPATWWLSARLRQTREQVCDAEVTARVAPLPYAHALARVAELHALHAAAAANGGELLERVERIVGRSPRPRRARWLLPIAAATLALGFTTGDGAVARPTEAPAAAPVTAWTAAGSLLAPIPARVVGEPSPARRSDPLPVVDAPVTLIPDEAPAVRILPLEPADEIACVDLVEPPLSLHVCGFEADLALVQAFEPRFDELSERVTEEWLARELRVASWARSGFRFGDPPAFTFTPPEAPVQEQLEAWAQATADYADTLARSVPEPQGAAPDPRCVSAYEKGLPVRWLKGRCRWSPTMVQRWPEPPTPATAAPSPPPRTSTMTATPRNVVAPTKAPSRTGVGRSGAASTR
ncbi:MAG: M56 family metallopeptidase [Myxococcota bacterium]